MTIQEPASNRFMAIFQLNSPPDAPSPDPGSAVRQSTTLRAPHSPNPSSNVTPPIALHAVRSSLSSFASLRDLSDDALLSRLGALVKQDQELTVEMLLHLGEVEVRGLHCAKGCSSLFTYCVQRLGCSEEVAYSHSIAPGNLPGLIERAIDLLIEHEEKRRYALHASRLPKAKSSSSQRPLDRNSPSADTNQTNSMPQTALATNSAVPVAKQDPDPVSLAATFQQDSCFGLPVAVTTRSVPAEVRRKLWQRDGGQCSFVDDEGHRCTERHFLQIEHRTPYARGGPPTLENLCLMCRAHNRYQAKVAFGDGFVRKARERKEKERLKRAEGVR